MKVVILAGGLGTRLSEETQVKPKPMAEIGEHPILWHIMKIYGEHGFTDFVVCLGYKGYVIKEYFANYFLHNSDVTFDLQGQCMEVHQNNVEPWRVTLVDTGADTQTGGRLKRVAPYVADETFMMTYGDGVADVDLGDLLSFHEEQGRLATVTAVQPPGRFGALRLDDAGSCVRDFVEKPEGDGGWMNGGFFVLEPRVFDYIDGDASLWEKEPLEALARGRPAGGAPPSRLLAADGHPPGQAHTRGPVGERRCPLETLVTVGEVFAGRRVFVTGHTGFKGSWLSYWLTRLGADVTGYALEPPTEPSLFEALELGGLVRHVVADVRDAERLARELAAARPEVVFHLAAQPIVRESYVRAPSDLRRERHGHRQSARGGPRQRLRCRDGGSRHERQVLPQPRRRAPVRGGRRHGRPRPLQREQGLRGARHRGLRGELLRRWSRCRGHRPRRQRHRRRRLGSGPDRARLRPGAHRGRSPSWCATRTPCAPGSTCSSRSPGTCCSARLSCGTAAPRQAPGTSGPRRAMAR